MSDSSELGITELYLQSIYIEKLHSSNRHSLIYEILPSPGDVVRVWEEVECTSSEETTQHVFLTLLNAYIMVSKEDVGSLAKIIVGLIFSPFPAISRKAFSVLSHFCSHNFRSFMRLVATNSRFTSKKILEFHYLLIEYLLTDEESVSKFKVPSFILVRTLMRYRFYSEGETIEDEENLEEDDDLCSSGECLKEVILNLFDDKYNTENWKTEDKIRCFYILSGLSMISLEFARMTMPFLINEIYESKASIREVCLSLVFEILFIHPCLFSENEDKNSDSKNNNNNNNNTTSRKRKRRQLNEEEEEDEDEDEEDEDEGEDDDNNNEEEGKQQSSKKKSSSYGNLLIKFVDGPTERIQVVTIIGLTRLLLGGPDEEEEFGGTGLNMDGHVNVLTRLVKKYTGLGGEGGMSSSSQTIAMILMRCFSLYHRERTSHQIEIGTALVSIVLNHFDDDDEDDDNESHGSLSKEGSHMVQFLIDCIDKKHHTQTVENIKFNIEKNCDLLIDHRVIQQWLHLI